MARKPGISRRSLLKAAGAGTAGAVLLPACGRGQAKSPQARGSAGVSVTDQRGTTITLDHPARRVVTLPMPAASMLVAADRGVDHLVGMNEGSWVAIRDGVLGEIFPKAEKVPHGVAGEDFSPNVETILGLNPDVVVQWGDHGVGIVAPLENAGLKVVGLTYGTQRDLERWVSLFGALLGKPDRAKAMLSRMRARLDEVRKDASAVPGSRPKIVYFLRFSGGLKVAGHGSYNDFYIGLVGGRNPARHLNGQPGVDVEQVLAWDPDIILLGNFDPALPDDVYGSKVWQGISAVRSKRVYKVPLGGYRWDPPCQESPLMWRWLFMLAHPEVADFDLRREITEEYGFLYGYRPSPHQIDAILWTRANGGSRDYRQFDA